MVPLSFGCGSAVFAASATLAPSRAARSAIASPMPRLPPDTNSVLPLSDVIAPSFAVSPADLLQLLFRGFLGATVSRFGCAAQSGRHHVVRIGPGEVVRFDIYKHLDPLSSQCA